MNNADGTTRKEQCEFWNEFDAFKVVADALNLLVPREAWGALVTCTLPYPHGESFKMHQPSPSALGAAVGTRQCPEQRRTRGAVGRTVDKSLPRFLLFVRKQR